MTEKLILSSNSSRYWIDTDHRFAMRPLEKFISYFFDGINISIQNKKKDNDSENDYGVIYDIQDVETPPNKKLNIMLSVENCPYFSHYKHFNKFNRYNNPNINIFFYGFINKIETNFTFYGRCQQGKETNSPNRLFIAIPIIYVQMNYFQKQYNNIYPQKITPFENKKFCLIATGLNTLHKKKIFQMLQNIGKCDMISDYTEIIGKNSIYHDTELLNLFNQYLFVFVCENAVTDGYITEKIFNCYFARTIPIYYGSKSIINYFNKDSFINISDRGRSPQGATFCELKCDQILNDEINALKNKELYEKYIKKNVTDIINENYDDENYQEQLNLFITNTTTSRKGPICKN